MDNKSELLVHYEKIVRKGFPIGEVRSELIIKGYSEKEANGFMKELYKLSAEKGQEASLNFRNIIAVAFIIIGVFLLIFGSYIGIWLIISGAGKMIYDFLEQRKVTQQDTFQH